MKGSASRAPDTGPNRSRARRTPSQATLDTCGGPAKLCKTAARADVMSCRMSGSYPNDVAIAGLVAAAFSRVKAVRLAHAAAGL